MLPKLEYGSTLNQVGSKGAISIFVFSVFFTLCNINLIFLLKNMSLEKIYLGLFSKAKVRKETILTSYIDLLSQQPNSTTKSANRAGFDFACQLDPQKDIIGIQNIFFLPAFGCQNRSKYIFARRIFFHRHF